MEMRGDGDREGTRSSRIVGIRELMGVLDEVVRGCCEF